MPKISLPVLLLFLLVINAAFGAVPKTTAKQLSELMKKPNSVLLVEFYAPDCTVCDQLEQAMERSASVAGGSVQAFKMDFPKESPDVVTKFNIVGNPTVRIIRDGVVRPYLGTLNPQGMMSHFKLNFGSPQALKNIRPIKDTRARREFMDQPFLRGDAIGIKVLGCFEDLKSQEYRDFEKAARVLYAEARFGLISDAKVARGATIKCPSITLFRPFEKRVAMKGQITFENILSFVDKNKHVPVAKISADNSFSLLSGAKSTLIGFLDSDDKEFKASYEVLKDLAAEFGPEEGMLSGAEHEMYQGPNDKALRFAFLDNKELPDVAEKILDATGAKKGSKSNFAIISGQQRFVFDESEYADKIAESSDDEEEGGQQKSSLRSSLAQFVTKFTEQSLRPFIKSAEPPKDNSGPVKVLTANTFDDLVINNDRNVLVEFYAPWCGHCQKLAPIYEKLGQMYSSDEKVVIAKFDANDNDPKPEFQISGFPTLLFFPANDKRNFVVYKGMRNLESLVKFVNENKK